MKVMIAEKSHENLRKRNNFAELKIEESDATGSLRFDHTYFSMDKP